MIAAFSDLREDLAVDVLLEAGWEIASSSEQVSFSGAAALRFFPAKVPGTVSSAPPGHDLIATSLHGRPGDIPFAQAFRSPGGRTPERRPIDELGIGAEARLLENGTIEMLFVARRFAYGVRASAPGWIPDDAYFGLEPGVKRGILLRPLQSCETPSSVTVTAINAEGRLPVPVARIA